MLCPLSREAAEPWRDNTHPGALFPLPPYSAKRHSPQQPRTLPTVLTGQVWRGQRRGKVGVVGEPCFALPATGNQSWSRATSVGWRRPTTEMPHQLPHPLLAPLTLLISMYDLCSQWIWGGERKAGKGGFLVPLLPMILCGRVSRDLEGFLIGPFSPTPQASRVSGTQLPNSLATQALKTQLRCPVG